MTWTLPEPVTTACQDIVPSLPRWLLGPRLGAVLLVIARGVDALADYLEAAVKIWMPGRYSDETLGPVGRERRIVGGPLEPATSYAARQRIWRQTHRRAGGWLVLAEQLRAYWTGTLSGGLPVFPEIQLIANNGTRIIVSAVDGSVTSDTIDWDWDSYSPGGGGTLWHSRYWIVLKMPDGIDPEDRGMLFGNSGKLGNGRKFGYQVSTSLGTVRRLGTDATGEQVDTIRGIVSAWSAPHSQCEHIIMSWLGDAWEPGGAGAQPDGTWNLRQGRLGTLNYWPGTRP